MEATGERDMSPEEVREYSRSFLQEGRNTLFSWPEFREATARDFFLDEYDGRGPAPIKGETTFEKGGKLFSVIARSGRDGTRDLTIVMGGNKDDLWKESKKVAGKLRESTKEVVISTDGFSYDGPGAKGRPAPRGYIEGMIFVDRNTRAVAEQVKNFFAEMKSI